MRRLPSFSKELLVKNEPSTEKSTDYHPQSTGEGVLNTTSIAREGKLITEIQVGRGIWSAASAIIFFCNFVFTYPVYPVNPVKAFAFVVTHSSLFRQDGLDGKDRLCEFARRRRVGVMTNAEDSCQNNCQHGTIRTMQRETTTSPGKKKYRRLIVLIIIGFVLIVGLALFRFTWLDPNSHFGDMEWLQAASEEEIRTTSHMILWWPWGNHHDACLLLIDAGDESSIPYLEKALARYDYLPDDIVVCTYKHCQDALKKITAK
jgi:hypothetical protein